MKSRVLDKEIPFNYSDLSAYIDKTAQDVVKYLVGHDLKLATAESCTGGLLAGALTSIPGASKVIECGIVSYSDRIKAEILNVPMEVISQYGVVSEQVALLMAGNVKKLASADIGVGITGFAGPASKDDPLPAGTIYVSIYYKDRSHTANLKLYELSKTDRDLYRLATVAYALEAVLEAVKG